MVTMLVIQMIKSISGYVFMMEIGVVSWSSRKQTIVTLSTTEAEFVATTCACQAIWLRMILSFFVSSKKDPLPSTVTTIQL